MQLKHLINFRRTLGMPLINCKINLILTWSKSCVLTDLITTNVVAVQGNNPARPIINAPTGAAFEIKDKIVQNCTFQVLLYQPKMITNF